MITLWTSLTDPVGTPADDTWDELATMLARPLPAPRDPEKPGLGGWSPARFTDHRRAKAGVLAVTAIVLDIDSGDVPLDRLRDLLSGQMGLRAIVHGTRRWTPSAPRWRVVIAVSREMTPDEHATVWGLLRDALGKVGVTIDVATRDPSRFWYLPCSPQGGAPYAYQRFAGERLDVDVWLTAAKPKPSAEARTPSLFTGKAADLEDPNARDGCTPALPTSELPALARISMATRRRRALAYVEHAEPAVSGSGGHAVAMRVASAVVRGFALGDSPEAREVLARWSASCDPPWSAGELAHKIREAAAVGSVAWGSKLGDDSPPKGKGGATGDGDRWGWLSLVDVVQPLPPIPWLCEDLRIAPGGTTLVAGYGYSRKTMALQAMAMSVAAGKDVWGQFPCRQGRVVHLDYEQGNRLTRERYQRLARGMGVDLAELAEADPWTLRLACLPRVYLDRHDVVDSLLPIVDGAALVIVDSLRAAFPAADENSSDVRSYLDRLNHLSDRTGAAVAVIHHARKPQGQSRGEAAGGGSNGATFAIRGSSALFDAVQSTFIFAGEKDAPTNVQHQKDRLTGSTLPDFGVDSVDVERDGDPRWGLAVRFVEVDNMIIDQAASFAPDEKIERKSKAILAAMATNGAASKARIGEIVRGNKGDFEAAWKCLRESGSITSLGSGKNIKWVDSNAVRHEESDDD